VSKSVLAIGPFIGSFEQEILTYRPHMRWIELNSGIKTVFYSSHFNRKFLYPQVSHKRFVPVYKQITRQEIHQDGYSHKDVDQRDFITMIRQYKDRVVEATNCAKKEIDQQSLPYVKYISPVSIYQKIFEPIKVPISKKKGNIIFIPEHSMNEHHAIEIFDYLKGTGKFSVIGDMKCHLAEENEVLQGLDYLSIGYKKIITAITNAQAVITPCSHWTAIANMQGVPVISWGDTVGQYKQEGIYNFNNSKSRIVYHNFEDDITKVIKQIDTYFQEFL
jgi:hypothetical protein